MMTSKHAPDQDATKTHVLHIASGDLWAGAEVMLFTLACAMHDDANTQVSVILLNTGMLEQKLRDAGIDVVILDESHLHTFKILRRMNTIVRSMKPDIIHSHRVKENILGSITAWHNNIPSLRTTHGAPEHSPPLYKLAKRMILFLDWFSGRFFQRYIVAVSSDLAKKLESRFPASMIKIIENGIHVTAVTSNTTYDAMRTEDDRFHFGIAGRLVPVKRVDLFIEAAIHLKRQHPELLAEFHIYGDGPLSARLNDLVRMHQAEDYIHFEGHSEQLSTELARLDALLMTSDHEGLPMVLLEAMCLHVPVIAHSVGGIPTLLDQGRCGTLIRNHTAEAFADTLSDLAAHPESYQQRAALAIKRIERHYSAVNMARQYLALYQQALH